jgi:SAM-dependent methyltransferase
MGDDPRSDIINRQYEKWPYPAPIADLDVWRQHNWEHFDPRLAHRMFWPDKDYRPDLDILIAGCGTNQAAVFAYENPDAKVVAVDISESSLTHQRYLKDKHGLRNLDLRRLPIEELPTLGLDFDLVVSTGVLMIMADPLVGMKSLAQCVRPDGAIGLMLYALHGRVGVYQLQSVFQALGLGQDDTSLRMVKKAISLLPATHPFRAYATVAPDLKYDAGLVDTFLIGRDRGFTVDDCIDLVEDAGLAFQGWFFNSPYHPHEVEAPGCELYEAFNALPERTMWAAMESFYANNGCHFFMACRRERPVASYKTDFAAPGWLDYVPLMRHRAGLDNDVLYRFNWRVAVPAEWLPFVRQINGRRTIREIAARVDHAGDAEAAARTIFESLWRLDFVAMARKPKANPLLRPA